MNRRGFFGVGLASIGGFFFPQKVKASDQWWEERDYAFEGHPVIHYLWPRDRLIHFVQRNSRAFCRHGLDLRAGACTGGSILVPTFNLSEINTSIEQQMRDAIADYLKSNPNQTKVFLHVIEICGIPGEYGILMDNRTCHPVTDCWEGILGRRRER